MSEKETVKAAKDTTKAATKKTTATKKKSEQIATNKTTTKKSTSTKSNKAATTKPATPVTKPSSQATTQQYDSSFASQVLKLVNQERAKGGLQALTMSDALVAPANKRAQEIKTQFSHTRPNGSQWSTVLEEYGVSVRTAGENLAYGYNTPEAVVTGWMNSPGHRANIMNGNFNKIGIGVYKDSSGTVYCTQIFSN
ncbi:MAG: putative secreted protein [Anaerocolumna sp.]|nr:putative secreted protein [Anaerocolumna sp.]